MNSVSNSFQKPASGLGSDSKNRSVQFETHLKTQPAASWRAKAGPVPVGPQVFPGVAKPVGSNLQFWFSGFLFIVTFGYPIANR